MEELAKKGSKNNPVSMNIEVTEEEQATFDSVRRQMAENKKAGKPLDYNIPRVQLEMIGKFLTPFQKAADIFINDQRGRGNSEVTITHYQQSIRKMCKFFCWVNAEDMDYDEIQAKLDEVGLILNQSTPQKVLEITDTGKPLNFVNKLFLYCSLILGALITICTFIWGIL